jgi:hypothetical protein
MDRRKSWIATIVLAAITASIAFAQPTTFLGPTAHLGIVKTITDDSAFAIAGEAGPKNLRLSGTAGWEFDYHQRIKGTAEYVRQRLTYSFYDGQQDVWMGQGAIGLNYEYDFRQVDPFNTLLDLTAYYSHAPSKGLGVNTYTSPTTITTVSKRVAGSDGFSIGPGMSIVTLDGTTAGFDVTYNNVQYDTKYRSGLTAKGIGGTLRLAQVITDDVKIGGSASVLKPYNEYAANLSFANIEYYGMWTLSGFGAYTIGKNTMPNSYNVGLGADYFIDETNDEPPPMPQRPMPQHQYKDYKDYKDMPPLVWQEPDVVDKDLLNWVAVPVMKLPVQTVPDQKIKTVCAPGSAPTFSGTIPPYGGPYPSAISTAPFFTGSNLTYTMVAVDNNMPSDSTISINSTTGVITITVGGIGVNYDITVTATNSCGSATSNTFSATD